LVLDEHVRRVLRFRQIHVRLAVLWRPYPPLTAGLAMPVTHHSVTQFSAILRSTACTADTEEGEHGMPGGYAVDTDNDANGYAVDDIACDLSKRLGS
jgi:hypothetical protein